MMWLAIIKIAIGILQKLTTPILAYIAGRKSERSAQVRKANKIKDKQLEDANNRARSRDELASRMRDGKF